MPGIKREKPQLVARVDTADRANEAPALRAFDMADHLKSDRAIARYLTIVLKEGDTDELIRALGHAARARGMADVARDSGLGRESLYKALRPGAHPRFETILKVCAALGIRLEARA